MNAKSEAEALIVERMNALEPALRPFPGGWAEHAHRHFIWIVTPSGYAHSRTFEEAAQALQGAFADLGGSAPVVTDPSAVKGRLPIIYGANLLPANVVGRLPPGSIVMNLEQVSGDGDWFKDDYVEILKTYPVLDYSPRNLVNLRQRGIGHAELLEVGYHESLHRIKPAKVKDIDVLFYGSMNERREKALAAMRAVGLNVVHLFGVYGAERDAAIARAKIVLNMHYYQSAIFELIRVSYLLANSVCVLTEGSPDDPELAPYARGLAVEPYERLAARAVELVKNDGERMMLSVRGWDAMRRRPLAPMLKNLMDSQ